MRTLGRSMFGVYALALPRGHGFGERLPYEAWQSKDGKAYAIVTRHAEDGSIGLIVMRRRTDGVWAVTHDDVPQPDIATATALADVELEAGRRFRCRPACSGDPRQGGAGGIVAEVAGETVASANAGEKSKTLKKIVRSSRRRGRAAQGRAPGAEWMAFPPAAYTVRGGVDTVAAHAKVEAARSAEDEPDPTAPPAAALPQE
ncbi:hypothetical protein TPR58_14340 [Sphingomonas sp. HF-S3]|uniref:Uncharacterized protein n=1 Tax=Sphingomonas rustica TaxID=3103142 RepID=A0ABV0BAY9_9SPHN